MINLTKLTNTDQCLHSILPHQTLSSKFLDSFLNNGIKNLCSDTVFLLKINILCNVYLVGVCNQKLMTVFGWIYSHTLNNLQSWDFFTVLK